MYETDRVWKKPHTVMKNPKMPAAPASPNMNSEKMPAKRGFNIARKKQKNAHRISFCKRVTEPGVRKTYLTT